MVSKKGFGMPLRMGFDKSQVENLNEQVDKVNQEIVGRRPSNTNSEI